MDHVAFDREPPATLTTMVMAFGGWIDAGRAATGALRHLIRELGAERLASIDPEEFFVLTQERPEVRLRPDGEREIQWPRSEFFAWRGLREAGGNGLLLFCGPEPHQRWRTYTKAFLDVAERCGVRRIVSLGALLASAPHTRPIRVTARCTDPRRASVARSVGHLSSADLRRPDRYISSVVLDAAERRDMQHVGFMGQAPHYLPDSENPAAIQALVSYAARLLRLSPDMSRFAEAIQDFRIQCDRAVARDRATREHVRRLEQQYDAATGEEPQPLPDGELDSEKLMQDPRGFPAQAAGRWRRFSSLAQARAGVHLQEDAATHRVPLRRERDRLTDDVEVAPALGQAALAPVRRAATVLVHQAHRLASALGGVDRGQPAAGPLIEGGLFAAATVFQTSVIVALR